IKDEKNIYFRNLQTKPPEMKYALFKVKPFNQLMSEAKSDSSGLKRALSAFNLVFLGIGGRMIVVRHSGLD
ncbi:MAG: hypothetical protein MUF04_12705, partial [Akkermansiaceae bacterium]|nr:hypothetical protein [Akkermansiaceae bacterium]